MEDKAKRILLLAGCCVAAFVLAFPVAALVYKSSDKETSAKPATQVASASAAPATPPPSAAPSAAEPTPPAPSGCDGGTCPADAGPVRSTSARTFGEWKTDDCSTVDRDSALRLYREMAGDLVVDCRKPGQNWEDVWGGDGVLAVDKLRESGSTFNVCDCRYPVPKGTDLDKNARYKP